MYDKTTEYQDRESVTKPPLAGLPDEPAGGETTTAPKQDWSHKIDLFTYGGVPVQKDVPLKPEAQATVLGPEWKDMGYIDETAQPVDVANQDHYSGDVQPIDLIKSLGWMEQFAAANVIKYVARYNRKNGVEDLKKAQTYLKWLIEAVNE